MRPILPKIFLWGCSKEIISLILGKTLHSLGAARLQLIGKLWSNRFAPRPGPSGEFFYGGGVKINALHQA